MAADPTSLSDAQAALAEAHRRTDALAVYSRRIAHDLSNFLTVIRTYSELLIADTPPDAPSRSDLTEIGTAADQTVTYLQRASAFGRAMQAPAAPLLLDGFIAAVVAQASAAGTGPIRCLTTSGARVLGAASAIADGVHELVTNAREAAGRDQAVLVRTRSVTHDVPHVEGGVPLAAGSWGVIEVRDAGPGFDASILSNACDPFVTTKSGVRGAGLGLSIARAAAWGAGGQLTIGREGDETVVALWLPITGA